ncbi:NADH-quinone oxidoreductase subunit D [Paenibacillus apiarius]|uniref:NADH-quinone oxidoreductase subunit D n=1 Tax=Paenibacillus apiarius TaxID=46240 RepID=A0ABT4DSX4_9BACL|nr:NADH-quinone oxidoreductase subunit D [Paenibacillus apiarius]MBN3523919.1 NADH-quinone oxidoreductase subunit D [Paenibacillus apiarius]MCY9514232.1 NADH-quinone oxidoreductase subunit D [Paenibacillus apiarius]MCY9520355.1 NADH-quinone oxidoreductase subunit D [Paenibacillus apiarius]MCY9554748.1 NADH-quinone oxidoreductase subunit D [Paenibacillus apiarius]MCY9557365.1 NADH-quinone oxidoreductase subunit D [Paenibacillus apiarius]
MIRTEELLLNVGPQHPSTHGVFRIVVKLDGEVITEATPVMGYLHRGTEKLAESLNYTQIIPYTDRMDYVSAMTNNYVLVHAVEKMMSIEIPERAEFLRLIVMELQRVASHLVWWGTYLLDIGAMSPFLYAFRDREIIIDLFNELCGARLTYNYMRVGGVKWDAPPGWIDKVREFLPYMKKRLKEYNKLVSGNEIFLARIKGVGAYDAETAIAYGLSGANLRCTGVNWDLRKNEPYSLYDRFEFDVPLGVNGDCYDRYLIRMEELRQSLRILEQAVEQFPSGGETMGKVPRVIRPPAGEMYARIESPRGEIGCYIISKGKAEPYRLKFRRPSFVNLQIFPKLLVGETMTNLITILGGVDIVVGEVDC